MHKYDPSLVWATMSDEEQSRARRYLTGRHKSPGTYARRFGGCDVAGAKKLSKWLERDASVTGRPLVEKARERAVRAVKQAAERCELTVELAEVIADHVTVTGPRYRPERLKLPAAPEAYEAVVPIADLHFGKWGPGYSRAEAREALMQCTAEAARRLSLRGRPDRITLVMLGDGLHVDTLGRTTTKGTPQTTDGDPETLVTEWFDLVRDWVDAWRTVAPVSVVVIPGNHDRLISAALRAGLRGWYRNAPDVDVAPSLSHRQYFVAGGALFMAVHGDTKKPGQWAEMFACEASHLWSSHKYKYIIHGHFHQYLEIATHAGVEVIRCPSLSGSDPWELSQGYPSDRKTLALVVETGRGVVAKEIVRP